MSSQGELINEFDMQFSSEKYNNNFDMTMGVPSALAAAPSTKKPVTKITNISEEEREELQQRYLIRKKREQQ
jgi:hypothetical protein